jgi:hypothetical protein
MSNSEQDVIIDLPPSHLEEDAGDELNAAQLGESNKNEKSSGKTSKMKDSNNTEILELRSETKDFYIRSTSIWIAERKWMQSTSKSTNCKRLPSFS